MLATVFRENWGRLLEAFHQVEASGEPALEQLRRVAKILLRSCRDDPDLVRVMVREVARSPHLQQQVGEIREGFLVIQRIVERGQAEGAFRCDLEPRLVSWIFYGALEELLTGWVLGLPEGTRRSRVPSEPSSPSFATGLPPVARRRRRSAGGDHDRAIWSLGLGAFGLAFSLTTTAAYLPPLLGNYTSSTTLIAAVLAAEGLFAIALPLVIGPWSDTFHTPLGRRRPFMLAALGPLGFASRCSRSCRACGRRLCSSRLLLRLLRLRAALPRALPRSPPADLFGRAQGIQHLLRGIALGTALIGGGALFHVWEASPFLVAAVVVTLACLAPIVLLREDGATAGCSRAWAYTCATAARVFRREPDVRKFLIANSAWEGTFSAARTFVVLYITVGLGQPLGITTAVLAAVAGGYIVSALVAGRLGDRFGLARVIFLCSFVYGGGLLLGGLVVQWHSWYLPLIFLAAIAGGSVMTLAWGLLFTLMPAADRGAIAGLATTTKGFGLLIGPLLAGGAIDLLERYFPETHGYQVLWPICALPVLLVIPLVASLTVRAESRSIA